MMTLLLIALAQAIKVSPDEASGVYTPGAVVTWTIEVAGGEGAVSTTLRHGGAREIAKVDAKLVDGKAKVTGTRKDPGALLLEVRYQDKTAHGGAVFAPGKIAPSMPPPDDFGAFWDARIAELRKVPVNAVLTPLDVGDPKVEYFKITMDNAKGAKIHGQIARPAGGAALPAILQVQWAGVYGLHRDWVLGHARGGWLAMNISAHDLPIDEKPEFYKEKAGKELNDYPGIGNDDRETAYFLRMFLSCARAVDYLAARPDWGKKALVVHGGSQGGYQAIVTAGLCPEVTAMAAGVPAGCDHTGEKADRAPGWPNWASRTWQGKDKEKMTAAARYFDAMNFAPRVTCPTLVGIGLIDTACPPEGAVATVNQFKGPKKLILMPLAGHGGDANAHSAYYAAFGPFLDEQKKGPARPTK